VAIKAVSCFIFCSAIIFHKYEKSITKRYLLWGLVVVFFMDGKSADKKLSRFIFLFELLSVKMINTLLADTTFIALLRLNLG